MTSRRARVEELVRGREQDSVPARLTSHFVSTPRQTDRSTAVGTHGVVKPSTRSCTSGDSSGAGCCWMGGPRTCRLGYVDGSRVGTVVEHGKTDSSVIARGQVVVLKQAQV